MLTKFVLNFRELKTSSSNIEKICGVHRIVSKCGAKCLWIAVYVLSFVQETRKL